MLVDEAERVAEFVDDASGGSSSSEPMLSCCTPPIMPTPNCRRTAPARHRSP